MPNLDGLGKPAVVSGLSAHANAGEMTSPSSLHI